jgi:hypothetical protein
MAAELVFKDEAAAEYDRAFAHVTMHFMPFLLRAARVVPGMHVLDIATGTGLSAEAALTAVGPRGHVVAADVSPAWVGPDVPLGAGVVLTAMIVPVLVARIRSEGELIAPALRRRI